MRTTEPCIRTEQSGVELDGAVLGLRLTDNAIAPGSPGQLRS